MTLHTPSRGARSGRPSGFTLVELLVVIGIIAILIGILLPSLSAARRSAQQVKCGAALQEIGLGYQLYSNENGGWWPVAKYNPKVAYAIGDDTFTAGLAPYWFNFIAPYVSASKIGYAASNPWDAGQAHRSILWGCPAFDGYLYKSGPAAWGSTYTVQIGYGMNGQPLFPSDDPTYEPPESGPKAGWDDCIYSEGGTAPGFFKQVQWKEPADRCLIGDSRFWLIETEPVQGTGPFPDAVARQNAAGNGPNTYTGPSQTLVDIYRHGKNPPSDNKGTMATFDVNGGKIAYNMLFCDGHVGQFSNGQAAYMATRRRFPN